MAPTRADVQDLILHGMVAGERPPDAEHPGALARPVTGVPAGGEQVPPHPDCDLLRSGGNSALASRGHRIRPAAMSAAVTRWVRAEPKSPAAVPGAEAGAAAACCAGVGLGTASGAFASASERDISDAVVLACLRRSSASSRFAKGITRSVSWSAAREPRDACLAKYRSMRSPAVKFAVELPTRKAAYEEVQPHGYEVDLAAARADRLVLADHVTGETTNERARKLYLLLNDPAVRTRVVSSAADRYGYRDDQVQLRLYVGRFAAPVKGHHEARIHEWAAAQGAGQGPIEVIGLDQVVGKGARGSGAQAIPGQPVLVTMKVLQAAGLLDP